MKNCKLITMLLNTIVALLMLSSHTVAQTELEELVSWKTGSFSSEEQAEADTTFFDIHLEMVKIWENRVDGHWIYVEQATASRRAQYATSEVQIYPNRIVSWDRGFDSEGKQVRGAVKSGYIFRKLK